MVKDTSFWPTNDLSSNSIQRSQNYAFLIFIFFAFSIHLCTISFIIFIFFPYFKLLFFLLKQRKYFPWEMTCARGVCRLIKYLKKQVKILLFLMLLSCFSCCCCRNSMHYKMHLIIILKDFDCELWNLDLCLDLI